MISRLILVLPSYYTGKAAGNRMSAYAKAYAAMGKEVYLILGSAYPESSPQICNVNVINVASRDKILLYKEIKKKLLKYYNDESVIYLYGTPLLIHFLSPKKYHFYYECTEIPFYGRKHSIIDSIVEFYKLRLIKKAKGVLVISNALMHYYKSKGVKNIAVVNMFVDSTRFNKSVITFGNKNYVTYCGTISSEKDGVDCLIKAFDFFHSKHNDYYLRLIGRFENKNNELVLKKLVSDLSLEKYVIFTGMVAPDRMPQMLCESKMLVLARPNNEQAKYGFPTKLGEYLATGNPVVLTKVGEIDQYLTDGINCVMSEPDNPKEFAEKMSWVVDNYDDAVKIGERGKELTNSAFSSEEQAKVALHFMEALF